MISNGLETYHADVGRIPLLSAAEERVLAHDLHASRRTLQTLLLAAPCVLRLVAMAVRRIAGGLPARRTFETVRPVPDYSSLAQSFDAGSLPLLRAAKLRPLLGKLESLSRRMTDLETQAVQLRRDGCKEDAVRLEDELRFYVQHTEEAAPALSRRTKECQSAYAVYEGLKGRLASANLRLASGMARRWRASGVPLEDLQQEANAALLYAIDRYDPGRNVRFFHVAKIYIRRELRMAVQRWGGPDQEDEEGGRRDPADEDLSPDETVEQRALRSALDFALDLLPYREAEIVRLRHGLAGGYCYSYDEIARIFRLSREGVRRIVVRAMEKLRDPAVAKRLASFLDCP